MTPEALAHLHASAIELPPPWSAAGFRALLADPHVFLAAEPLGFALGRAVAGEAELLTIAVAPEARRRGLGRRLLEIYEALAIAREAERSFLEVAKTNAPARALYAACGYAEAGRRRAYYVGADGARIDALVLARPLGGSAAAPRPDAARETAKRT